MNCCSELLFKNKDSKYSVKRYEHVVISTEKSWLLLRGACASFHIQFIIPFQINCWNNILNIIFTTNMSWLMSALFISILISPRSHFYTLWKRQKKVLQLPCIILLSYRVLKSREAQNLVEFQSRISKNRLFQPHVDFFNNSWLHWNFTKNEFRAQI